MGIQSFRLRGPEQQQSTDLDLSPSVFVHDRLFAASTFSHSAPHGWSSGHSLLPPFSPSAKASSTSPAVPSVGHGPHSSVGSVLETGSRAGGPISAWQSVQQFSTNIASSAVDPAAIALLPVVQ